MIASNRPTLSDATPADFVFTLKAPRYIVERKPLVTAGNAIERFVTGGLSELKQKLGAILWQLPAQPFDAADVESFLKLLPRELAGQRLRHALEVKGKRYMNEQFLELAQRYGAATVFVDSEQAPRFADTTADFVYARLKQTVSSVVTGYTTEALSEWKDRALLWSHGGDPKDLPRIAEASKAPTTTSRDVFVFFIAGAKERAPAAALQLIQNLRESG